MNDRKRLQGLPERERATLTDFTGRLRRRFRADLIHSVWVFGSTMRGTADDESDIDLLIVVHDYTWELEKATTRLAVDVDLAHDVVLSDHVIDSERYAQMAAQGIPLYRSIREEGIDLWQIETKPLV